jgi:type I restriction enzyme S subunit
MHHLFTYGPVPVDEAERMPLKETEIGLVPEGWEVVRLGEVIAETQYGLNERAGSDGRYPVLRMNNLIDGRIDTSDLKYVNLDNASFQRFRLNKGDVLFNRTNSYELVGKTALFDLDGDYVFASYLVKVVVKEAHLLPEFLNYYLNWEAAQDRLRMLATRGVSQSNISATKLRGFEIPIPPLVEQHVIVDRLAMVDAKIQTETRRKAALEALFHSLLHHLMTGKVRVKGESYGP